MHGSMSGDTWISEEKLRISVLCLIPTVFCTSLIHKQAWDAACSGSFLKHKMKGVRTEKNHLPRSCIWMSRTYGAILCALDQAPFCSPSEWRLWEGWTKWPPVGRVSRWRTALPWPHWGPGFVSQRMRLLAPVRASVSCSRHENTILKHWSTRDMWEWVGAKWWMLVASHRPSPSVVPEELPLAPSLIKWMQSLCRKADLYVPWDTKRSQQLHLSLLSLWANTSVSMGERHMQASSAAGMETFNCCCLRCLHIGP